MTVKQLIKKLSKLPEDAQVTIFNNELYIEAEFIATDIKYNENNNTVRIESDYEDFLK